MNKLLASLALAAAVVAPALATTRIVTLTVPGMTCAACPITVRKALSKVDGVRKTAVILAKREVVVHYDDAKTNVAALTTATSNAGYLSRPVTGSSR